MEKYKAIKISLSTFFLVIAIIVILVMGYLIYKIYQDKNVANEEIDKLNNQITELESTVSNIQNNKTEVSTTQEEFSEEDKENTQNIIKTYYNLLGKKEVQDPEYSAPDNYVAYPNNEYMWTGILYNDFLKTMNKYMTDRVLESKFPEFINYNGYLYIKQDFNTPIEYEVKSMELQETAKNNCRYTVTIQKSDGSNSYTEEIEFERINGNFVISEIN